MRINDINIENDSDVIEIINSLYLFFDHTDFNLNRSIKIENRESINDKINRIIEDLKVRGLNKEIARKILDEIAMNYLSQSKDPKIAKSNAISLFEEDTNFDLTIFCSPNQIKTSIELQNKFEKRNLRTKYSIIRQDEKNDFQLEKLLIESYYLVFLIDIHSYTECEKLFEVMDFQLRKFSERLFFVNFSGRRMNYNIEQLIFKNPDNYIETISENEFMMIGSSV
jgi:hypothetical protein